ncbi:TetR/AcrR family transcriptional regulator [Eggerthella sp. NSJ-70]|uniref:TetR/AcrR family transcriptional regulator n=1 Tax=Eggerthella hominis TaxID=2763043 RepID=A0ABR7BUX0_9ACTN|nr:TetR/AcrR family transcriptional regulator [Eggerthella hominis]
MSTENPQKARSRAEMTAALVELLGEVPYRQVTVTMLAARSGYSRRTFYRHFDSVDAVMEGLMRGLGAEFSARDGRAGRGEELFRSRAGVLLVLARARRAARPPRAQRPHAPRVALLLAGVPRRHAGRCGEGHGLGVRLPVHGQRHVEHARAVGRGGVRPLARGPGAHRRPHGGPPRRWVRLPPVVGAGSAGDLPSRCQVGTSAATVRHPAADG